MVKILAALVAAISILNSSGASPGATEKVAALVARATCSGASHSSANHQLFFITSVSSKVFECVVSDCLGRFIENSGVLPTTKFTYRK